MAENNICLTGARPVPQAEAEDGSGLGAVVALPGVLWNNDTELRYFFINGTESQRNKVRTTIPEWEKYANIRFTLGTIANSPIRITFAGGRGNLTEGCGSSIEWTFSPTPTMYLPDVSNGGNTSTYERHVILHEFGHALGLCHEHQSPGRVGAVTLKRQQIVNLYAGYGYSASDVDTNIINIYQAGDVGNYSAFDPLSIMLYYLPATCNEEGILLERQSELSDNDKAYIAINYPRVNTPQTSLPWTFAHSLEFVGMAEAERNTMIDHLQHNRIAELRTMFNQWNHTQRALG